MHKTDLHLNEIVLKVMAVAKCPQGPDVVVKEELTDRMDMIL